MLSWATVPARGCGLKRCHDGPVTTCHGCGLELPAQESLPVPVGYEASPECWQLYGEVVAYAFGHPSLFGRWHQTCVDAFRAQHVDPNAPAISVAFALNGLYLAVEQGLSGHQIREAHGYLASTVTSWPRFTLPESVGDTTVLDVALASSPEEHALLVQQWGRSVWAAWSDVHAELQAMTDAQLHGWRPRTS